MLISSSSILSSPRSSPDSFDDGLRKLVGMIHSLWSWINELQQLKPLMCSMVSAANLGLRLGRSGGGVNNPLFGFLLWLARLVPLRNCLLPSVDCLSMSSLLSSVMDAWLASLLSFFSSFWFQVSNCPAISLVCEFMELIAFEECFEWFLTCDHSSMNCTKIQS